MMKKYLLFTFLLVFIGKSYSQDLHYTQFYNTPMNFNPSLTGMYNGDQRYMASIRDQWRQVPIPYLTFSASYDMKFIPQKMKKSFFSAGVLFNYDIQGDAKLNLSNLNLAGSYSYMISKRNLITAGALIGFSSRGFSHKDLTWDAQYDEITGLFDDRRDPNELLDRQRFSFIETGLGANYRWQKHSRFHITVGGAAYHLTQPKQDFNVDVDNSHVAKLGIRYALHGLANVKIAKPLDVQVHALYQQQTEFNEIVLGGLLKVYLNQQRGKMFEFHIGSSFRMGDAVIPTIAVQYNEWYVGFNYDITLNPLGDLEDVNHRGGPELHVSYIFKQVQPMKTFKLCPIF